MRPKASWHIRKDGLTVHMGLETYHAGDKDVERERENGAEKTLQRMLLVEETLYKDPLPRVESEPFAPPVHTNAPKVRFGKTTFTLPHKILPKKANKDLEAAHTLHTYQQVWNRVKKSGLTPSLLAELKIARGRMEAAKRRG